MRVLLLRLEAPLMSFGGPLVDQHGPTEDFPGRAMLTGLLGNALGYGHHEPARLERLQQRLRHAVRQDHAGTPLVDFQTVDLGQPHLSQPGWTTRGKVEVRGGASAAGTHIRYRHYLQDASFTVALTLRPEAEAPDLGQVAEALRAPARPLFLGRKSCVPAVPLLLGDPVEAESLLAALRRAPLSRYAGEKKCLLCWWSADEAGEAEPGTVERWVIDDRDWANQVHCGRRRIRQGPQPMEVRDGR